MLSPKTAPVALNAGTLIRRHPGFLQAQQQVAGSVLIGSDVVMAVSGESRK